MWIHMINNISSFVCTQKRNSKDPDLNNSHGILYRWHFRIYHNFISSYRTPLDGATKDVIVLTNDTAVWLLGAGSRTNNLLVRTLLHLHCATQPPQNIKYYGFVETERCSSGYQEWFLYDGFNLMFYLISTNVLVSSLFNKCLPAEGPDGKQISPHCVKLIFFKMDDKKLYLAVIL